MGDHGPADGDSRRSCDHGPLSDELQRPAPDVRQDADADSRPSSEDDAVRRVAWNDPRRAYTLRSPNTLCPSLRSAILMSLFRRRIVFSAAFGLANLLALLSGLTSQA